MNTNQNYAWKQIPVQENAPTPKWLPIDPNNLPIGIVATTNRNVSNPVFYVGVLHKDENGAYLNIMGGGVVSESTHYIPLSDLLNLPFEA